MSTDKQMANASSNVIKLFNPKDVPFGELSNNAKTPLSTGHERWPTLTNYIYGMMLTNPNYRQLFMGSEKALPTKDVATVFNEYWKKINIDVISSALEVAIAEKFRKQETDQQRALLRLLLETAGDPENPRPIHYMSKNVILGVGGDNDGNNLYGRHLAVYRDRILAKRASVQQEIHSSERDTKVYKSYMVFLGLRKALREGNDSSLSEYRDKDIDTLYTELKDTVPDINEATVVSMYRNGGLDRSIDYALEHNTAGSLIAAARRSEIRNYRDNQKRKAMEAVLTIYATSILSSDYPDLPTSERTAAMEQQFNELGYYDMSALRKAVWELYKEEKFDEILQPAMLEAVEAIEIPDEESITVAEAAANYPEIASPTGHSPTRTLDGTIIDIGAAVDSDGSLRTAAALSGRLQSVIKVPRPIRDDHTSPDDMARLREQKRLSTVTTDVDILDNITSLESQRETYLKQSYNKSESGKVRHHSKQKAEELLQEINKLYSTASVPALQEMLTTLDKSYAKGIAELQKIRQEKVQKDEEIEQSRRLYALTEIVNNTKNRATYIRDRLNSQYQHVSDKTREIEKQRRKERKDSTPPPKAGVLQLAVEREGAVKIYERARNEGDPGYEYRHLSPLCCDPAEGDMLLIDGRSYPTIMHYVLVRRLASIPSIKSVRNAYPMLCKDENKCNPPQKDDRTSTAFAMDEAYTRDPRNFKDIPTLDALYLAKCNEDYDKRIVEIATTGLDMKFQNRRLQDMLLLTGTAKLEWADKSDKIIGIGPKGDGQNFVGKYLMTLRDYYSITRDKDDIHVLTENDVATLLVGDEFLNHWLKMRIRDMCRVLNVVRSYLYLKDDINPPITEKFVRAVLDNVYQPCSHLYQLSNLVTVPVPDYFRRIIKSCPGFSGNETVIEVDEDDDDDYARRTLEQMMNRTMIAQQKRDNEARLDAEAKAGSNRIEPVVDLIWRRLAVMIHMVIKSQDRPTAMNAKQVIGKATLLLAAKTPCVRILRDQDNNCIASAILNVMQGLRELNSKLQYDMIVTKQDVEAAASIILDRDLLDDLEPAIIDDQVFVEEDGEEVDSGQTRRGPDPIVAATNANSRDINAIATHLRRVFEDDVEDPEEIAALVLGGVETIRTYPVADTVKQGRVNFFASLR